MRDSRVAGVSMTLATVIALVWANIAGDSYRHFWSHVVAVPGLRLSAQEWVNQGLMVAFFVLVGLEIRREIAGGELRSWRRASAPVAAAIGGMVVPAALYAVVLHGRVGSRGWGIPMATDVAFALGALALISRGASVRMRVFLLTLAVADDILSIAVLVCFYTGDVRVWSLLGAIAGLVAMTAVFMSGARNPVWSIMLAAITWWALVHAGVEASVVGVAVGLLVVPVADRASERTPSGTIRRSVVGTPSPTVGQRCRPARVRAGQRRRQVRGVEPVLPTGARRLHRGVDREGAREAVGNRDHGVGDDPRPGAARPHAPERSGTSRRRECRGGGVHGSAAHRPCGAAGRPAGRRRDLRLARGLGARRRRWCRRSAQSAVASGR